MPQQDNRSATKLPQAGEIATLLVKEQKITEEQLNYALRVKIKLGSTKTMLDIIQDLGYVTAEVVREVLRNNRLNVRIGAFLVELGYLKQEELEAALNIQQSST